MPVETEEQDRPRDGIHVVLMAKNADIRASLERTLRQSRLGHTLTVLENTGALLEHLGVGGHQARPAAGHDSPPRMPNLILLALDSGEEDDAPLMQALKGDQRLRAVPVVALVGRGQRNRTRMLYHLGASSVIQLPLYFADLVNIMRVLEEYWGETARLPRRSR